MGDHFGAGLRRRARSHAGDGPGAHGATLARKAAPRKKAAARKPAVTPLTAEDLAGLFLALRALLTPYARRMTVKHDGPGLYYLETIPVAKYGEEVFFGAVQVGKDGVTYHLLPLHVFPELLEDISPALRRHLKGKSAFRFRALDASLVAELKALTRAGFEGYRRGGVFGP